MRALQRGGRSNRACSALDEAQAMLEAALTLPLLLLFLVGVLDLGRVFTIQIALPNAAREAARYCALHPGDTAGTKSRAIAELNGVTTPDTSAVVCPAASAGGAVTVKIGATFTPFTPLISQITGGPIRLEAPATMVVW
jgi:Flp pilus assembly protein TadG